MPALDSPQQPREPRDEVSEKFNARLGLFLFILYLSGYVGYVGVNTFAPKVMDLVFWGMNVALISGMSLIAVAVLLALVYSFLCKTPPTGERS
jgi:uncharacterized membrane protein (DUF485 family)